MSTWSPQTLKTVASTADLHVAPTVKTVRCPEP